MMVEVKEVPKDGTQFVVMWMYNGRPWAETYRFEDGELMLYNPDVDGFVECYAKPVWRMEFHVCHKIYVGGEL